MCAKLLREGERERFCAKLLGERDIVLNYFLVHLVFDSEREIEREERDINL